MRKLFVIGIGTGNPEHVTIQAINALNKVDVFFVMDKGDEKHELIRIRQDICERYITNKAYRYRRDQRRSRRGIQPHRHTAPASISGTGGARRFGSA